MKIFGIYILTQRQLQSMIWQESIDRAPAIVRRHARIEDCLRATFAARHRLRLPLLFCADGVLEGEKLAIEALAGVIERSASGRKP